MIEAGATVPDFTLTDDHDRTVQWNSLRGKPVIVFAYPRANTPGCTKEACSFRDLAPEFAKRGAVVLGISADSPKAQGSFREKYELTMPLLADPQHVVLAPWGIWGEKTLYGKKSMGIRRSTFLFDKDGVLRKVWPNVKVEGHADKVLAALDEVLTGRSV
jgi:peroxiredoxin Q/BCP